MPLDKHGLTVRQRKFCDVYVKTTNGAEAARIAGYSERTAREMASENLSKPHIKKYVEIKMKEAIEKAQVGLDWRLDILKRTAAACLDGRADKDGCVDARGAIGVIAEINKMAGDHAPTTSNLNVSEKSLDEAKEVAEDTEKEINEIKTF